MKPLKTALAVTSLLAAMAVMNTPALALRSLQYRAQGHGLYLNSSGTPKRYSGSRGLFGHHHHRSRRGRPHRDD